MQSKKFFKKKTMLNEKDHTLLKPGEDYYEVKIWAKFRANRVRCTVSKKKLESSFPGGRPCDICIEKKRSQRSDAKKIKHASGESQIN